MNNSLAYYTIILCSVLLLLINTCSAIKCWYCCSDADSKCADPFDNKTLAITNSDQVKPIQYIFDKNDYKTQKSTMCRKIWQKVNGEFSSSYKVTIGADFAVKTLEWDESTRINLHLWDIAGHERFGALTGIFYRHSVGAALVFDLTRPDTFKSIKKWLTDLRRKVSLPGGQPIPTILLANKGDITTKTIPAEINDFCLENNIMAWFITSAKNNIQIDETMLRLTNTALINHHSLQFPLITDDVIKLSSQNGAGPPQDSTTRNNHQPKRYYCCTS